MSSPVPDKRGPHKGRDVQQMEDLKKLIMSETSKLKAKKAKAAAGIGVEVGASRPTGGTIRVDEGSDDEEMDETVKEAKAKALKEAEEKKIAKAKGVWRKGKFIAAEDLEEHQYRDRAAERRLGENPDYDGTIEKMVEVDAEKSKYLGGDLKHTHLVRGLDYALLLKVKEEARKKDEDTAVARVTATTQAGKILSKDEYDGEGKWRPPVMKTYTAKAIYVAMQTAAKTKPPNFARIVYEFDLCEDAASDVPTLLNRSNAEAAAVEDDLDDGDDRVNYAMDMELFGKVKSAVHHWRQHGKHGKRRKRSHNPEENDVDIQDTLDADVHQPKPKHKKDNANIFDNTGGYIPPWERKEHADTKSNGSTSTKNSKKSMHVPMEVEKGGSVFSGLERFAAKDKKIEAELKAATVAPSRAEVAQSIRSAAAKVGKRGADALAGTGLEDGANTKIDRDIFGAGETKRGGQSLADGTYGDFADLGGASGWDSEGEEPQEARSKLGESMNKKPRRARGAKGKKGEAAEADG